MPTKQIKVLGIVVEISVPYAEGHVLTTPEASVLNQTFAENVRNNCAKAVKDLLKKNDQAGAAAYLQEYASKYVFNERTASVAVAARLDPVEKEAIAIAKAKVAEALEKKGIKRKDLTDEQKEAIEAKIAETAKNPKIIQMAEAQVAARKKRLASLDEIEL